MTDSVVSLKGVGPAVAENLKELSIHTVEDMLAYIPFRYEDFSKITPISKLSPGPGSVEAVLKSAKGRYVRRGMHITEALFSDPTGSLRAIWFNQPYREKAMRTGEAYYVSGTYELNGQRFQMTNPSAELTKDFPLNTARIIPIYRQTKSIKSTQIRKIIGQNVERIRTLPESLPEWMIREHSLMSRAEAIEIMHFPPSLDILQRAQHRLGFDEIFELSLASLLNKLENSQTIGVHIPFDETVARAFVKSLPFDLTGDQRKVAWQIYQDMSGETPMNRLVEGDVGSGKTVVGAMAAIMAMHQGFQVALMAPTELLARQHAQTIHALLAPMDTSNKVGLLVGSMSKKAKETMHTAIADGTVRFIIGTSALIQDAVAMQNLSLIIVDEQHRFGVDQRKALMQKAGRMPHVLSLTATPIPRSLALTLYGEMDVSILSEKPKGRLPILTEIVQDIQRASLYERIGQYIANGQQAYVVCPLIVEGETSKTARTVEKVYKELSDKLLASYNIGLLHGKMNAEDKQRVMQEFARGDIQVLVSTTVIEVGVDVPNASCMVIESADHFGLAQLHQLRGRVGRGDAQSYCFLVIEGTAAPSRRLRAIASSNDGFKLAELDLELRGPGAIYGAMQHGALDLRVAKLTDTKLIAEARQAAAEFIRRNENLVQYTEVHRKVTVLRAVTHLN